MRRAAFWVVGLLLTAAMLEAAPSRKILLEARDLEDHPLSGLRFAYGGVESRKTNQSGATELELPLQHQTGQQIKIHLVPGSKRAEEWLLVNPQVNIPINRTPAELVLMRRSAFRQFAAEARDTPRRAALGPVELTAEDRKRAVIHVAARYGLTEEQLETALRSFSDTQNYKDRGIVAFLSGQYSQAEELLNKAGMQKEKDFVETLLYLGVTQYQEAKYPTAAKTFSKALALRGDDADLLSWLGESLSASAEWPEAERLMRRAIVINETNFGPGHPKVASSLSNLALLLQNTNRSAEAESLIRRALAIDEKSFGSDHPEVATDLGNLSALLLATSRHTEAEPLMRRALAIDEKNFGIDHPKVAAGLNNLAQLLQDTARLTEAEPLMRRALAIDEKSFGMEHPYVARDLNNLATLLQDTNRMAVAESLMRRALAIDEKNLGTEHPEVATNLNNLAALIFDANRFSEAEPLMRRALTIDEKSLGAKHPDVARDLNNLARLLQDTGRLAEGEPLMRRALNIFLDFSRRSGHDHPHLEEAFTNYRRLLQEMGRSAAEIEASIADLIRSPE